MNPVAAADGNENCRTCKARSPGSFCDVSADVRAAMDTIGFSASYPKGSVLFTEGDTSRGVMVLCRGRVKVFMSSSEGRTLILRVAKPGEMLGLCGVISNRPRQAAAETIEPSRVTFFRREDFLRLLQQHGELSLRAAEQLSVSYATACEQARSIGLSGSAPKKLARFLLDWTADGNPTGPAGRTLLTLTHEEIGQMISASRETVTRTLGEFKAQRLVNLKGSMLSIPNRAALEELVNL